MELDEEVLKSFCPFYEYCTQTKVPVSDEKCRNGQISYDKCEFSLGDYGLAMRDEQYMFSD